MNIELMVDVQHARKVIDAQYTTGYLDYETYSVLHRACDTIVEAFGTSPSANQEVNKS